MDDPVWTIERGEDGWWSIDGEGAPDAARADDFGFIMETAAEEARRLGLDGDDVIEVRRDGRAWRTKARHLVSDYGREEAHGRR